MQTKVENMTVGGSYVMIIVKHIVFLFIYAVCHHCLIKGVPYGCNHTPFGCENFAKIFSKFLFYAVANTESRMNFMPY